MTIIVRDAGALAAALAQGGHVHVAAPITLSKPALIDRSGTWLSFDKDGALLPAPDLQPSNMLNLAGTAPTSWAPLAALAGPDDNTISLLTDPGWMPGDWVAIQSRRRLSGLNVMKGSAGSLLKVVRRSGAGPYHFELEGALGYEFAPEEGAVAGRAKVVEDVVLESPHINRPDFTLLIAMGIHADYCARLRIVAPEVYGSKQPAGPDNDDAPDLIKLINTFGAVVEEPVLKHSGWYGVSVNGMCRDIKITGGHVEDVRHAVSVVWTQGFGEPIGVLVEGLTAVSTTLSSFDCHDNGRDIRWSECVSLNAGDCGFQIRTSGVQISNCHVVGAALDGIRNWFGAEDCRVVGGSVSGSGRLGLNLSCARGVARGLTLDSNGGREPGGGGASMNGGRFQGGRISRSSNYAFDVGGNLDTQLAPLLVEEVHMPADDRQQTAFHVYSDRGRRYNTTEVRGCSLQGYSDDRLFTRTRAARAPGEGPPLNTTNRFADLPAGDLRGTARLRDGSAIVQTPAIRRRIDQPWAEDLVTRVEAVRLSASGSPGQVHIADVQDRRSFRLQSSSPTDQSSYAWRIV